MFVCWTRQAEATDAKSAQFPSLLTEDFPSDSIQLHEDRNSRPMVPPSVLHEQSVPDIPSGAHAQPLNITQRISVVKNASSALELPHVGRHISEPIDSGQQGAAAFESRFLYCRFPGLPERLRSAYEEPRHHLTRTIPITDLYGNRYLTSTVIARMLELYGSRNDQLHPWHSSMSVTESLIHTANVAISLAHPTNARRHMSRSNNANVNTKAQAYQPTDLIEPTSILWNHEAMIISNKDQALTDNA